MEFLAVVMEELVFSDGSRHLKDLSLRWINAK